MDYLPSFFIGVKKRIAALFIGTTIRFLSFYSILLFPENITSWPHSIFFFPITICAGTGVTISYRIAPSVCVHRELIFPCLVSIDAPSHSS